MVGIKDQMPVWARIPVASGDDIADMVMTIAKESKSEYIGTALAREEAFLNSIAAGPDDVLASAAYPYGGNWLLSQQKKRRISRMISGFTAEQVNSITTRMAGPLLGQREVLYFDGDTADKIRPARVQEALWEKAIRSPYTRWSELCWRTLRDVCVYSRAYVEVCYYQKVKYRRRYNYGGMSQINKILMMGLGHMLGPDMVGVLRSSTVKKATVWDGPILRAVPYGTVHKDKSEPVLGPDSRFLVKEREMTFNEIVAVGEMLYPKGSKMPLDKAALADAMAAGRSKTDLSPGSGTGVLSMQSNASPANSIPDIYRPNTVLEFRGEDPTRDAEYDYIAWVINGRTIGCKTWDGSGSPIDTAEFCWDPMNGFSSSASPAIMLRRTQEMLNLLEGARLDGVLWDAILSGGVHTDAVNRVSDVKNLKPGDFFEKISEKAALEPIKLGTNHAGITDLIREKEAAARLQTAGTAAVVGTAPPGAGTATEFSGISQGAFDRIGAQQEINADGAVAFLAQLVIDSWRDHTADDGALRKLIGQDGDLKGCTLADLDVEMEVVPMAARYHAINRAEVEAMDRLFDRAAKNPEVAARLKPEIIDDYAFAINRSRGWRWIKTADEMAAEGQDAQALNQASVDKAAAVTGKGEPSPPAPVPTQPNENMAMVQ